MNPNPTASISTTTAPETPNADPGGTPLSEKQLLAAAAAVLVAVVLVTYTPSLSGEFVRLDDYQYVVDNPLVCQPSWESLRRFFTEVTRPSTVDGYYQPLTMTSLMIDAGLSGGGSPGPGWFHFTNLALHAATCILVLWMVRLAVGGVAVPLLVALLFAVHPVHVESVSWISQRKTVLSAVFAVGCVACYLKHGRTGRVPWLLASVLAYGVGALAKPTVMLLPLVLPLLDLWPLGGRRAAGQTPRRSASLIARMLPFLILMVPITWIAWTSQAASGARLLAPNLAAQNVVAKSVGLACHNLFLYLGNIFWPMHLSPYRDLPDNLAITSPGILWAVLGTGLLAVSCLTACRWSKPLCVGGVAFVILLAPALGTIRFAETCVADRFLYLPTVFLLLPLGALLVRLGRWLPRRATVAYVCIGLLAGPLALLARAQQTVWHDSRALWGHVVESAPRLAKGHVQYAAQLLETAEFATALDHARRAVNLRPRDAGYLHVLGRALVRAGHAAEAVVTLERALDLGLGPIEPLARVSLAEAQIASGDHAGAGLSCERAIALGRGAAGTYESVGDAALTFARDNAAAAEYYERALALDPDNLTARWNLGTAMSAAGRTAEALMEYEQVLNSYRQLGLPTTELEAAAIDLRRRLPQATPAPESQVQP